MTKLDISWVLTSAALIILMQAGFGALEAGLTRAKNSINVAIKNLADFVISCLLFWFVGFAIMFGPSIGGWVGFGDLFPEGDHEFSTILLFNMAFCGTATTIMSGAIAERSRFSSYLVASVLVSGLIYPTVGHWVWNPEGVLASVGFADFAGGSVVHVVGGAVALAGVVVVGPRLGRFDEDDGPKMTPSSLPLAVLGCVILTFGWLGFNGGSALALTTAVPKIVVNTILAGCTGGVVGTGIAWWRTGSSSAEAMINGLLSGLVAVTAGANIFSHGSAALVGAIGGLVGAGAHKLLLMRKLDDVVSAVPVHLMAGMVGTIAVGVFGDLSILDNGNTRGAQLLVQLVGTVGIAAFAFICGYAGFRLLDATVGVRVSKEDELRGLNFAEHGASTEIYDLLSVMNTVGRSGDLNARAKADPYSDVGQIAKKYNDVLDTIQGQAAHIEAQFRENQTILFSISEGLVAVDEELRIRQGWSAAAEKLLGTPELLGKDLGSLLFEDTKEGQRQRARLEGLAATSCALFFPEQFTDLVPNAPARIHRRDPDTGADRYYAVSYSPLVQDGTINGLIVLLSDESEIEQLRAGAANGFKMLAAATTRLAELLEDHTKLQSSMVFLDEAIPLAEELATTVEDLDVTDVARVFRDMHTIKGGARMLELQHLTHFAHEAETILADLRSGAITEDDAADGRLREYTCELRDSLRSLARLWNVAASPEAADPRPRWAAVATSTEQNVTEIAASLGKEVSVSVTSDDGLAPEPSDLSLLNLCLIHLGRNAVDHGIETPAQRREQGKSPQARIEVHVGHRDGELQLRFEDDGRGIDAPRVARLAFERGVTPTLLEQPSNADLLGILTAPGFSSAAEVSDISGRGVGLDAVAAEVRERGGRLELETEPGRGTTFTIRWPAANEASLDAA